MIQTGDERQGPGLLGAIAALWAAVGWSAVLLFAIWRLAIIAMDALDYDWNWLHWTLAVGNLIFMAWSEGYKGFQLSFSPRTAARVHYLAHHPGLLSTLLAPAFAVGYFFAGRRTLLIAWLGTLAIIILILLVHRLPQPWRGIVDMGVVLGLTWGVVTYWVCLHRAFNNQLQGWSPDVPVLIQEQSSS